MLLGPKLYHRTFLGIGSMDSFAASLGPVPEVVLYACNNIFRIYLSVTVFAYPTTKAIGSNT